MQSLGIIVAAALISLGIFQGNRYEIVRTHTEDQQRTEAVFRIDKLTGQVSRCHVSQEVNSGLIAAVCAAMQESSEPFTLAPLPE